VVVAAKERAELSGEDIKSATNKVGKKTRRMCSRKAVASRSNKQWW
jgi:hypothetical protein